MSKDYVFWTTCVGSVGSLIDEMVDDDISREVTYETMLKHCDGMLETAMSLGYERSKAQGLTIKDDFQVSFHKSFYAGAPCYYFDYSRIEHIWILRGWDELVRFCERKEREEDRRNRRDRVSLLASLRPKDNPELLISGRGDGLIPADFDPAALLAGIKVELEHTNSWQLAREIAMDHLAERDDYYILLEAIDPHHNPVARYR